MRNITLAALFLLTSCVDTAPDSQARVCERGETQSCACLQGALGVQDCDEQQSGWAPCQCPDDGFDVGDLGQEDPDGFDVVDTGTDDEDTGPDAEECGPGCENTPGVRDCPECGGGAGWAASLWSYRGICAYDNGAGTGLQPYDRNVTETADGQLPLGRYDGAMGTFLGAERKGSYAFQCVELARRLTHARDPSWRTIRGNACAWWNAALRTESVDRFDNGGDDAPRPDDLFVYYSPGDVCGGDAAGHIGVVVRVTRDRVWMLDQNRGANPISFPFDPATNEVGTFGRYVLKGWLRVGARDETCGIRSFVGDDAYSQLVTCPAGSYCDLDAERCRPLGECAADADCADQESCQEGACVCDPTRATDATWFRFDGDGAEHCFTAGPYAGNTPVEGCSTTHALARDAEGEKALFLRDFHDEDPQLISPKLSWTLQPTDTIEVAYRCDADSGSDQSAMWLYLSRDTAQPSFGAAEMSFGPEAARCDGRLHTLRFPLRTIARGTRVGWFRLDPLNGDAHFAGFQMWIRHIGVLDSEGGCEEQECVPGEVEAAECGLCGSRRRICTEACVWGDFGRCQDEGVCEPGDRRTCSGACGDGTQTCTGACSWGACSAPGEGVCNPGERDNVDCGMCGSRTRQCSDECSWGSFGACQGEGVCTPGESDTRPCDRCGVQRRTCTDSCTWGAFGACSGQGSCDPGDRQTDDCGDCGERERVCADSCEWGSYGSCGGEGECTPGDTDSCGRDGVQTCSNACRWGSCEEEGGCCALTSVPRAGSWQPTYDARTDCVCRDDDCHSLYIGKVRSISGNDVSLEFKKTPSGLPSQDVRYWIIVLAEDELSCAALDDYVVRAEGTWRIRDGNLRVTVNAWPDQDACENAGPNDVKRLALITDGAGQPGRRLWFQRTPIEVRRNCD